MRGQKLVAGITGLTLGIGAVISFGQTPPAATPPAAPPVAPPATQPTTAPTTQEAAYNRLLGADAPERPILPTGKPTIDLTTGSAAVAPGADQVQTQREGSYIKQRIGRLAKAADGQGWEFVFNADANAMQDPPMKVIPNLKLGVMEDTLETMNRDLQFRVTGMVTEYRGRNYILLENVAVVPDVK